MEKVETVRAADTCLRVLERIAFADSPMGVTQIAAEVGIAKGAVFKHLRTLMEHGMVTQDSVTSHYALGPKLWLIAQRAPTGQNLSQIALPLMRATRDELGVAVVLSVPTTRSAFVVATLPSNQPIEIGVRPGGELSLHSSAQGKVLLAFGPKEILESLPETLPQITPKSVTQRSELVKQVEAIKERGYASAPEESLLGINAVAAPIFDNSGQLLGSIGLIASIQHLRAEPSKAQLAALLALTKAIGQRAGHR
ncbi:IclR family transcriptional regulator [Paracoccus sp. (in: a-proteobacteria)]|uniref:IclR family transcriptional regulator n=1 Tax=Paracoccus sp. TaxID=267 RepID=UPI0028A17DD9|nr:IclR family transcriptional regulator [Paracoccus sp. (in: a-proteobacteria)]